MLKRYSKSFNMYSQTLDRYNTHSINTLQLSRYNTTRLKHIGPLIKKAQI